MIHVIAHIMTFADAKCASVGKKINDMTERMFEVMKKRITKYSQRFNQSRENYGESYSSLGSPTYEVSLCDNFDPPYLARLT